MLVVKHSLETKLSYCGELVRAHDPDRSRCLCSCLRCRRGGAWRCLRSTKEIAKTREVVSEAQLGRIRLQWWRKRSAV
ncbi:MAG: hypothetical protein R3D66_06390 [Alphaproteobacteria bacterium]